MGVELMPDMDVKPKSGMDVNPKSDVEGEIMGIFKTTHKVTPEEKAFQSENLKRLENEFDVSKALGIKKYPDAMQFIYDRERRCFVVVEGPENVFKLKNPYIIDFDQVKDVYLEVEEFWTESPNKHEIVKTLGQRTLTADKYDEVFWRYNMFMNIETSHPYAETIRYRMNYNTVITKVSGFRLTFPPRGLELNGKFRGEEIKKASERVMAIADDQRKAVGKAKKVDRITGKHADEGILEGALRMAVSDIFEEKYVKKMETVAGHLDRAYRIAKLLGKA